MSTILISLDPAENCGYAIWRVCGKGESFSKSEGLAKLLASGVMNLITLGMQCGGPAGSKTMQVPRYCALGLDVMLSDLLHMQGSEGEHLAVAYEDVHHHTGIDAAQLYGGHRAMILYWAQMHFVKVIVPVSVQAGKKALTGKGNADKRDSVLCAEARFNIVCQSHDEADAIGIGLAAMGSL